SISRFCAAIISLGGGFDLLVPSSGATTDGAFSASVLFPRKRTGSITIDEMTAPPMKTAIIPILVCRLVLVLVRVLVAASLCRAISICRAAKYLLSADSAGAGFGACAGRFHQGKRAR